ncbi:MAG: TonB-dependent receptor plug domain-containing protein, partial [Gemmatimonadota bacterium]
MTGTVRGVGMGPLEGAYVWVVGLPAATAADSAGTFALQGLPTGDLRLAVCHIGYHTEVLAVRIAETRTARLEVELRPTPLPMEAVLITAQGRPSLLRDLAGSAAVVASEQVRQMVPRGVVEAIAGVAGVALGSDMPWASRPHIRGLSRDHVALLVDGCRVSTTSELAAQFGTVAAADVARIEVLKGPVSVLYGTGSTGGIVNVITREGHFASQPSWRFSTASTYESVAGGLGTYGTAALEAPRYHFTASQAY